MFVPFIPYDTVADFNSMSQTAELLNTTVAVVETKCRKYGIPISHRRTGPGLDKESFIQLHKCLFNERPRKRTY